MALGFNQCDVINPEEDIPAYVHIDSMTVNVPENRELGPGSHKIVDAWVRAGNEFVGVYELPATIPILKKGETPIFVRPGILNNGISNTRAQYPFYIPVDTTLKLTPKQTDSLGTLESRYADQIQLKLQENFEDTNNLRFENSSNASFNYDVTFNSKEVFEGDASLKAEFDDIEEEQLFEIRTKNATSLNPTASNYLEVNFKTNIEVTMGVIGIPPGNQGVSRKRRKLVLNETKGEWTKIYINLKDNIQDFGPDYEFRIFFRALKNPSGPATFYLDNVKLIHD